MKKLIILIMICCLSCLAFAEEIVCNPEYVAQYLGKTKRICYIGEHKEFNIVTLLITDVHYEYRMNPAKKWVKEESYFIIGNSENTYGMKIDLRDIVRVY